MRINSVLAVLSLALGNAFALTADAQEILPFPPTPSGSTPGLTIQDSTSQLSGYKSNSVNCLCGWLSEFGAFSVVRA